MTVITVCFNSVSTLQQTIDSIVGQTYREIEYIVIDGGSTDGTIDLIKANEIYIDEWVSEPDQGLYDAMNKGIQRATGDVIGILNSDDWYVPEAIEKVMQCFAETGADVVHGDAMVVYGKNLCTYRVAPVATLENIQFHMPINHGSVFVKRKVYCKVGQFDLQYHIASDYELMLRFFLFAVQFVYLPDPIVYFRIGGMSNEKHKWRVAVETRNIALRYLNFAPYEEREKIERKIRENYTAAMKDAVFRFLDKRSDGQIGLACLEKAIGNKEAFAIFGAGLSGIMVYEWIRRCGFNILFFIDNAKKKQGCMIGGVPVIDPEALRRTAKRVVVIIAIFYDQDRIEQQLRRFNLQWGLDYIFLEDINKWAIDFYIKHLK